MAIEFYEPAEFMKGAIPSNFFERVRQEMIQERNRGGYDPYLLERGRDWSTLSRQIVGAEDFN